MGFVKTHISFRSIFEYLICGVLIYLTGSAWIATHEDASVFRILSVILIFLCVAYEFLFIKSWNSFERALFAAFGCIGFLVLEFAVYSPTLFGFSLRLMWVVSFVMVLFTKKTDVARFMKCFFRIMVCITIVTLIAYIPINLIKMDIPYNHVESNGDIYFYRRYLGFFYAAGMYLVYLPVVGIRVFRVQSFFWEPGVYAVYLTYSLFYFVFHKEKKRLSELLLLVIAMLLTYSTTGIMIGIGLVAIHCVRNSSIKKFYKSFLYVPMILVAMIGIYVVWMAKKIDESGAINGSYSARMRDIFDGLALIAKKPVFGWGYKNYAVFEFAQNMGRGSSNGLITLGYTMGIVGLIIVLYPFVASLFLANKKNRFNEIIFSTVFVLTNMTEPLIFMPFMICLVAYQYRKCWLMRRQRARLKSCTNKKMSRVIVIRQN